MRPLRFHLNVTLDGCVDHAIGRPNEATHRYAADFLAAADALLLGRVTYQMMEQAWRRPTDGRWPDWVEPWMEPFATTIDEAPKHVVTSTLGTVDWNADIVETGDLRAAVEARRDQPGDGLAVGGHALATALTAWGLIDEYILVVHPVVAGHGPYLFSGLVGPIDLRCDERVDLGDGIVAHRCRRAT